MDFGSRDLTANTSRWLEAIWEPDANIYSLPGGIEMLDVSGDGDARFIAADIGTQPTHQPKLRVYKEEEQVLEHKLSVIPCGIVGFYSENGEPKSAALAVGGGSSVFIFKNMRPHFKYCLPHLDAHPKEREIWHKAGLEEELNHLVLYDELSRLLKELGAGYMSPRTLKFLSLETKDRAQFAQQFSRVPLVKANAVTAIATIRKDSWAEIANSYIVISTESGEIMVLDSRAFFVVDKHVIGWPAVSLLSCGLWTGDGKIILTSRDGKLGTVKRGTPIKYWEQMLAPIVAIALLGNEGVAAAVMDGTLCGLSRTGVLLWKIQLPGMPLDLASLPVPQSGLSLLAVSTARTGVRIYDEKHHVDTIKMIDSVSSLKYGRMGQEERTMGMITMGGGLNVKILKRTADFGNRNVSNFFNTEENNKFMIPKKTKLFVEQTMRERTEAEEIYKSFQQGFLRLKLQSAKKALDLSAKQDGTEVIPISLQASVLGLGPNYVLRVLTTYLGDGFSKPGLLLVFRDENANILPRVRRLPVIPSGVPFPVRVLATPKGRLPGKAQILLCDEGKSCPLAIATVTLPVPEEDLEV